MLYVFHLSRLKSDGSLRASSLDDVEVLACSSRLVLSSESESEFPLVKESWDG